MKSFYLFLGLTFFLISANQSIAQQQDDAQISPPNSRQYQLLEEAIQHYSKLKTKDPWTEIVFDEGAYLEANDRSPVIKEIRNRLELLGDFRGLGNSEVYNQRLENGVKRFQARHGLEENGIINKTFIKALNVPLDTRIKQLNANKERLAKEFTKRENKRIVANIPEYKLHVYENGREVLSMDIVVGKTTNKTVLFSDELEQVVFSPYWNVPESIVKNEILPAIDKNPRYLKNNQMEIVGTKNGLPQIRQKPGPKNSLGKVKFMFPNQYNIYFHDTPAKSLFEKKKRAFSHGCIRLSQPFELAKYLLKDDPKWTDEAIQNAMNSGTEKWVTLSEKIPVSISYYTAWVDPSGDVHFRDDIYGHDKNTVMLQ
ncbi:MAG: L,D-transpeptidase family protein [Sphingobacteriaceae bacterium]